MAEKKTKLVCIRTHGRWNKGDTAGFEKDTADKLVEGKNAAWKKSAAAKSNEKKPPATKTTQPAT